MKNEMTTTQFGANPIRIINEGGEVWFAAQDVCTVLGYGNSREALSKHVDAKGVTKRDTLTKGGKQKITYVNESGLYRLILRSHKPEAKKFQKWVTGEVLPSIRRTGKYEPVKENKRVKRLENGGYCVLGTNFIPYHLLISELGLSTNSKTMYKRRYKNPQMFLQINKEWFIREDYSTYLMDFRNVKEEGESVRVVAALENIKKDNVIELFNH